MQKWMSPARIFGRKNCLLLVGAEVHDRRADGVEREHRHRRAGAHRLVEEDELLDRRATLAAPLLGPADARPAVGAHLLPDAPGGRADAVAARELRHGGRIQQLLVVGAQLLLQRELLWRVPDFHETPQWDSSRSDTPSVGEIVGVGARCRLRGG